MFVSLHVCAALHCHDVKADVFSYGIILCEITARVHADPEILPRTSVSHSVLHSPFVSSFFFGMGWENHRYRCHTCLKIVA